MDTTIETIDTVINDVPCPAIEDISFGKEVAKTLTLSAVTTAGMVIGLAAVGLATSKIVEMRKQRHDKKTAEKAAKVDVSDKTPANENN